MIAAKWIIASLLILASLGFAAIVIMAIAIMGQLSHAERRRPFLEPDALLIIILTLGAFVLIYFMG